MGGWASQPPIYIGPVSVPTNEYGCSIIDTVNDYSYFGTTTVPGQIRKINMQASGALPTLVGSLTLNAGEGKCVCDGARSLKDGRHVSAVERCETKGKVRTVVVRVCVCVCWGERPEGGGRKVVMYLWWGEKT